MAVKEYLVIITDATALKGETTAKAITASRIGQLLIDLAEKGEAVETGKVSVEVGKGLSENDFTTALLNKLNGIAEGANAYVHPSTHSMDIMEESTTKKILTSSERTKLSGIADGANAYVHPSTHSMDIMEESTSKKILTASERTKLSGIADGANAYVHPASHAPSIISQDANNRFVTDAEKAAWNSKAAGTHTHAASDVTQSSSARFVSDTEKSTWNNKQAALGFTPENVANKNAANGYAGLGADGKINASQLPAIAISETFVVNSEAAMLALAAQTGDVCIRTDQTKTYILKDSNPALLASWAAILSPTGDMVSVNGKTGIVVLVASDLAEDETHRFVTDAEKAAWNGKAAGTHTHAASDVTQSSSARFVTDTEKAAWNSKAAGTHTHEASEINQTSTARFVTDTEKTTWSGKAAGDHTHSEYATATALTALQTDVTSAIQLINGEAGV